MIRWLRDLLKTLWTPPWFSVSAPPPELFTRTVIQKLGDKSPPVTPAPQFPYRYLTGGNSVVMSSADAKQYKELARANREASRIRREYGTTPRKPVVPASKRPTVSAPMTVTEVRTRHEERIRRDPYDNDIVTPFMAGYIGGLASRASS